MNQLIIAPQGLTQHHAEELLKRYGENTIQERRTFTLLRSFFSQFHNTLILLLIAAAGISFVLGDKLDACFIAAIVFLNAGFGVYQEYKAEHALQKLKQLAVTMVRVLRDGREQVIDSRFLVPGDMMYLEEGAKIPADAELVESWGLEVNEAALTGESFPVAKHAEHEQTKYIAMGTIVSRGRCYARVTQTGAHTAFGKIAKTLSQISEEKTPLQKKLEIFARQIGVLGIFASIAVFIISLVYKKTLISSFLFAVSLAVAAVPEGLPAVVTITLAIGVERMARAKAVVRKLTAVEALGSVTIVATDKTGTLTTNTMRVKKLWVDGKDYDASSNDIPKKSVAFSHLLLDGMLCSTASFVEKVGHGSHDVVGDPTEGSLLLLSEQLGMHPLDVREEWKRIDELPFDVETKRMTVVVEKGKQTLVLSKGAPESILDMCSQWQHGARVVALTSAKKQEIRQEFEKFARQGLRIIAFSYKHHGVGNIESKQIFLGFVGIADPIRPEVLEAVRSAQRAGIHVVMITGDNPLTAEAIGIEGGIIRGGEDILIGSQIDDYTDAQLLEIIPHVRIFARTTPEHKYRLVKLYQQLGEVVAVTGDGVNDALALKQADVGVAMGMTGTDVAKETADMVITDDNLATIIHAVEHGRNIFIRIRNAVKFLLACNLGEVMYILIAVLFHLPVMSPLQILYINLITDGLPALALAFSPKDASVMRMRPAYAKEVLNPGDKQYLFIIGAVAALLTLLSQAPFLGEVRSQMSTTLAFTTLILLQHIVFIDAWISHKPLLKNLHLLKNRTFLIAFFLPFFIHPFVLYSPLARVFEVTGMRPIGFVLSFGAALVMLIILDIVKRKPFALHEVHKKKEIV